MGECRRGVLCLKSRACSIFGRIHRSLSDIVHGVILKVCHFPFRLLNLHVLVNSLEMRVEGLTIREIRITNLAIYPLPSLLMIAENYKAVA